MRPKREESLVERTSRLVDELVAKGDRTWLDEERAANPLLVVMMCELSDKDATFAAQAWRQKDKPQALFATSLRCHATAVRRYAVRDQTLAQALRQLCERAPTPSVARYIYRSAHAQKLLAWIEKQDRSDARDTIAKPLRRAVSRKHAFAIVFETV